MAKIDTSKIEGYMEMTPEQKLAALEGMEMPETDYTGYVRKDLLEKANSEAASFKKQLREKQTADEQAAAQQAETLKAMQDELEALRKEKAITELSKRWMGAGYTEALATSTAKAMAEGNYDQVFKDFEAFVDTHNKAMKSELLKQTPTPPAGNVPDGAMKKADFLKLNLADKQKFAAENPELYASFYNKED
jgi:hypothetical protein